MKNTRVAGHALKCEGSPYVGEGICEVDGPMRRNFYDSLGVARCKCGWRSPCLHSNGARKRAYDQHKSEALNAAVSGD